MAKQNTASDREIEDPDKYQNTGIEAFLPNEMKSLPIAAHNTKCVSSAPLKQIIGVFLY